MSVIKLLSSMQRSADSKSDYKATLFSLKVCIFSLCDIACQNQAFVAEMSCSVMMFLGKNVTLAFI